MDTARKRDMCDASREDGRSMRHRGIGGMEEVILMMMEKEMLADDDADGGGGWEI